MLVLYTTNPDRDPPNILLLRHLFLLGASPHQSRPHSTKVSPRTPNPRDSQPQAPKNLFRVSGCRMSGLPGPAIGACPLIIEPGFHGGCDSGSVLLHHKPEASGRKSLQGTE